MSGLVQIVGQTGGASYLQAVDSAGRSGVRDADSIAQTTAVNTNLVGIDAVLDNSLIQQTSVNTNLVGIDAVLDNSLIQQTSVNTNLATLETSNQAIKTAVEGTLSVSSPTLTTTNTLLVDNVSVAAAATQTTASVDMGGVRRISVFGTAEDTSANIITQVSSDDTTWYDNSEETIYLTSDGFMKTINNDVRYIRWKYVNGAGEAKTLTLNASYKK